MTEQLLIVYLTVVVFLLLREVWIRYGRESGVSLSWRGNLMVVVTIVLWPLALLFVPMVLSLVSRKAREEHARMWNQIGDDLRDPEDDASD